MAQPVTLAIVQDRVYRAGVVLVVGALVVNQTPGNVDAALVSRDIWELGSATRPAGRAR